MTRSILAGFFAAATLAACATPAPISPEAQEQRRTQEVEDSDNEDAVQRMKDEFNTLHPDG
jgi:ABC-type glycerol-3-phosphate transport system substrate-binding protein